MKRARARLYRLCVLGGCVANLGCAHKAPAPPSEPAAPAAVAAAPGARPEERNHLLEASWAEVEVKARKNGDEVVSAIKLVQPKLRIFHAPAAAADAQAPKTASAATAPNAEKPKSDPSSNPSEIIDLGEILHKITPLDVDHIDILDGQIAFVDTSRKERPELWMHDLQLSVENLATRVRLTEGRPVLLTASATVARSGSLSIFITADPFEKGLTFSGRASIVGLETSELYRFIEPVSKLQAPEGTIDVFVEFDCRNGALIGGVKPVLKNVKIRPDDKRVFTVLKAWVVDLAVKIFSDRVRDRNAVATIIPIKGTITGPNVDLWPAIFGVLRNAFVEGLTSGYAHLPPATAEKPPSSPAGPAPASGEPSSPPASP